MKAIALRILITTGVAAIFIWFSWFNKQSVGYFAETHDGVTSVEAGTTPSNVAIFVLGLALFCLLMQIKIRVGDFRVAPLWRRFAAFLIDFYFSVSVLSSIYAVVPLLLEAVRTGSIRWHYERDYWVPADLVNVILIFVFMATIFMYFAFPLARCRQTMGCFILRIATVSAGGSPLRLPLSTAIWRTWKEFAGLCSPSRTIKERDLQGRTWYDRETGFTVVTY
jgi:uncharacterized RDD family membrane protein YckC